MAPIIPAIPHTILTNDKPAKSSTPTLNRVVIQQLLSHTQCDTTGYEKDGKKKAYPRYAQNKVRSAKDPDIIVAAVAANVHWKKKRVKSVSHSLGKSNSSRPINLFPLAPYAKLYPNR